MSWNRQSTVGDLCEDYVAKLLRNAGLPVRLSRKDRSLAKPFHDWDVASDLGGRPFTIECKGDMMAESTGNVAVEFHNSRQDRPSGISATKADLWVFVFRGLSVFVCHTQDLREFISRVEPLRRLVAGGDDNASLLLYRREAILPVLFRPMDDLTPPELRGLLQELLP